MDEQMFSGTSEGDGLTAFFSDSPFALLNHFLDTENISIDSSIYTALRLAEAQLRRFALDPLFVAKMQLAFGKGFDLARLVALQQAWALGDFSLVPPVKILSGMEIGRANAAFVASTNTIYLSQEFLERSGEDAGALIEEIGHAVDQSLNNSDSSGDEGAIFLALVSDQALTNEQLQQLYQENDHGSIQVNGEWVAAEFQNFVGDASDNTIVGTASDDVIQGLDGNDSLYGLDGNDTLEGGAGDDFLEGGTGTNTIKGGDGNDTIFSINAGDNVDGGTGNDFLTLDESGQTTGVTISFSGGLGTTSAGGTIQSIEQFIFKGGSGNDTVDASTTNFTNVSSNPFLSGTQLSGGAGDDTLLGGSGNDNLFGNEGNDTLEGGAGDDNLDGGTGTNTINGGDGNDTIFSINAGDKIDSGAGNDFLTLDDSAQTTGVTISFSGGVGTTSTGGTIQNIEQFVFTGGSGNDSVDASATSFTNISSNPFLGGNQLSGGAGDDTLLGGSGNDNLSGNEGNDTLEGGAGDDNLDGGTGTNTVKGGAGNDTIRSINDSDNIDGGTGNDFLTLDDSVQTAGVTIGFSGGVGTTSTGGTIQNIEQFIFTGGSGNDDIDASATSFTNISSNPFLGGNQLSGGAGDDKLAGGSGNDRLYGEDGNDTLEGGAGDDYLDAGSGTNVINGGSGNDTLYSFNIGDKIDGVTGNDSLTLNGSANTAGVTISFSGGVGTTSAGGTIQNIEQFNYTSGSGDDDIGGSASNDNLNGGAGNDTLSGVDKLGLTPGLGEKDILTGGAGADRFILGDINRVYYDDLDTTTSGDNDYAAITDFNLAEDIRPVAL